MKKIIFTAMLIAPFFLIGCDSSKTDFNFVNTSHLDHLYEEIQFNGQEVGIIHIYCNYPDYEWVGDSDEGIACIDDVARAAVFYLNNFKATNNKASLDKAGKLVEFILQMQADNGYFYNFIFEDYSINKTHKNSLAQPNWWSWRAMWAAMEAYKVYEKTNTPFAGRILACMDKAVTAVKKDIPSTKSTLKIEGFEVPQWLPWNAAADQAAVLLLSLTPYYELNKDEILLQYINDLQEGICLLQVDNPSHFSNGAFLSWQNLWHAYGNSQAYSLITSSRLSVNSDLLKIAEKEINYFYKALVDKKYLSGFSLHKNADAIEVLEEQKYSQIAYNIRPMVYASLAAYEVTNDNDYLHQAVEIASWFFGDNPAGAQMYFPQTGIGFDGINSEDKINKNSGAESTIEALLTLQAIEKYPAAKQLLYKNYQSIDK